MTKSKSREEDNQRAASSRGRVESTHGGELVEAIAPEELEIVNAPECLHEKLIRDPSETDFNAFMCSNPDCGIVVLYDKS